MKLLRERDVTLYLSENKNGGIIEMNYQALINTYY